MYIDCLHLMDQTFQLCRIADRQTGAYLTVLGHALLLVQQEQRWIIPLPRAMAQLLGDSLHPPVRACWWQRFAQHNQLDQAAFPFLATIRAAVPELQHLWTHQELTSICALGYALHNMPQFLRRPGHFDAEHYRYSVSRVYIRYRPSAALHTQFAHLLQITADELTGLHE